eukprot:gene24272-1548_t
MPPKKNRKIAKVRTASATPAPKAPNRKKKFKAGKKRERSESKAGKKRGRSKSKERIEREDTQLIASNHIGQPLEPHSSPLICDMDKYTESNLPYVLTSIEGSTHTTGNRSITQPFLTKRFGKTFGEKSLWL